MKPTLLLAAILTLLLSTAAQAGRGDTVPKIRIRQTVDLLDGTVSDYTYSQAGGIEHIRNSRGIITTYAYSARMVVERIFDSVHNASGTDTFRLNAKGLADDMHNMTEASKGITMRCEYNSAGYMTGSRTLQNGAVMMTNERKYKAGNEVTLMQSNTGDKIPNMVYFTYYPKPNTIGNENMGMNFMGRSSATLLRESLGITSRGDTLRSEYSYHYDVEGRVSIKATYTRSALSDSVAYSYY